MKDGIHPNYRDVCFVDLSNGFKFVTRTCAPSKETINTKLYGLAVLPPDVMKKYTAVWTELKTTN